MATAQKVRRVAIIEPRNPMRALGIIGLAAMSALSAPVAAQPDTPPYYTAAIAINSHTVSADDFPAESIRQGEKGTVSLRFLIGESGDVTECTVLESSGYMRLDNAACSLVRRWKYRPATEGGKATTQITTANVVFRSDVSPIGNLLNFPDTPADTTLPPSPTGSSDPAMDVPSTYVPPPGRVR